MTAIIFLDLVATLVSFITLLLIAVTFKRLVWRSAIILFSFIIILSISHNLGNLLEWAGFTSWFDTVEDYIEILVAALWAFFFYTFMQEISERELRRSEVKYRGLFEAGNDAVFVSKFENDGGLGKFIEVNDIACQRLGYTREELLEMSLFNIADPGFVTDMENVTMQLEKEGKALFESVHETKDRRKIPVEINAEKFLQFNQVLLLSIVRDITKRKETERKLKEFQELDKMILDGSPVAFVLLDNDMRIIRVSSAFEKLIGLKEGEVVDKTFMEFMPPGPIRDGTIRRAKQAQVQGIPIGPSEIQSQITGRYLSETFLPIYDQDGRFANVLSVLEDITEQKLARDALEESEARYRMLFNGIHDGVVLHEMSEDGTPGRFLEVNSTYCRMTGYTRGELLSMTPLDLIDPDEKNKSNWNSHIEAAISGESISLESNLKTKSGTILPCEVKTRAFTMGDQRVVLSAVRDITDRLEKQENIKISLVEKETLLREIHHRVKNNLQVISGLLNLQSHYINDNDVREIFQESQNRIKTMALMHEELYQRQDLARINLPEYIRSLTNNLLATYAADNDRIKLIMDLEDLDISIDTAIPCGLIVNELVTNSLKHAFPEDREGEIRISFAVKENGYFELAIRDNGIGLSGDLDLDKTGSLGLRLVSILSEQLGCELQIDSSSGVAFRMVFPEYREAGTEVH